MIHRAFLFLALLGFLPLAAQTGNFLTVSSTIEAQLTSGLMDFRQRMLTQSNFLTSQTVQVHGIQGQLSSGTLNFTIPGVQGSFAATTKWTEGAHPGGYYDHLWSGSIAGQHPGEILVLQKDNLVGGFIHTSHGYFAIFPIGDNAGFLMKHDPAATLPGCGNEEFESPPATFEYICSEEGEGCDDIDVLVLVTPEARAFFDGISNNPFITLISIYIGLETPNIAIYNSGYPEVRLRTATIQFNDFDYNFPISLSGDLSTLNTNTAARDLRIANNADLVVLLTNRGYVLPGVANIGPDPAKPFAIVEVPYLWGPTYTYAHEVGHLFGARHNRTSNGGGDDTETCQHGWRFMDSGSTVQRTLLALYNPSGVARILHYSNPNISFNGAATGTVNDNNALVIRNTSCQVASYSEYGTPLGASLWAPNRVCSYEGSFSVNPSVTEATGSFPGYPPYSYNWSVSGCGSSYVLGNGNGITVSFGCTTGTIHVNLTVTSYDGGTASASSTVQIEDCGIIPLMANNNHRSLAEAVQVQKNLPSPDGFKLYPNPTSDQLTIELLDETGLFDIHVLDVQGKTLEVSRKAEGRFVRMDISGIPPGLYFLRINRPEKTILTKIVKSKP